MKNKAIFLFCLFLFLTVSSSLFAFNNKYFSVKDNGWEVKKKSDKQIGFILKGYTPDEDNKAGLIPIINIQIEEDDEKLHVVKFNQKELDELKDNLKNKAFKDYLESAKKASKTFLEKMYPNAPRKQVEAALDEIYRDSGITSASLTKIGSCKAYCVNFNISEACFRRFVVQSLHRATIIEFTYPKSYDIDSSKEYKDFVSSFKNFDKEPTSFNGFLYGTAGPILLKLLIVVVLGVVGTVLKRLKG